MEKKDLTSGLVLVATGAAFFTGSLILPWEGTGYGWFGAPGFVPAILAVMLAGCGLRLIVRALKEKDFYARMAAAEDPCFYEDEGEEQEEAVMPAWMEKERPRALLTVALCTAYILLLGKIPYMVATAAFIAGFILIFRGAGVVRSVLIGAAASVSIWFVFYKIFAVFLP